MNILMREFNLTHGVLTVADFKTEIPGMDVVGNVAAYGASSVNVVEKRSPS